MKEFKWKQYTVQITRKKVKNVNFRIRPENPLTICISIPWRMSYAEAVQMLDQPRLWRWLEQYQKKLESRGGGSFVSEEERASKAPHYQERLQKILPEMFDRWQAAMGVKCSRVTIRDTRSQWGSCNPSNGHISISVWLGAYPEECVEYVVVHELAHLIERGHNARFYAVLDQYYPDWRACRDKLRQTRPLPF